MKAGSVLGLVGILALVALIVAGCQPQKPAAAPAAPEKAMPEPVMEKNDVVGTAAESEAEPEEVTAGNEMTGAVPVTFTGDTEVLSQVLCRADGIITVVVVNPSGEDWNVDDLEFRLNVVPDNTLRCDTRVLAAGQSMRCTDLGPVNLATKRAVVQLLAPDGGDYAVRITCP